MRPEYYIGEWGLASEFDILPRLRRRPQEQRQDRRRHLREEAVPAFGEFDPLLTEVR